MAWCMWCGAGAKIDDNTFLLSLSMKIKKRHTLVVAAWPWCGLLLFIGMLVSRGESGVFVVVEQKGKNFVVFCVFVFLLCFVNVACGDEVI